MSEVERAILRTVAWFDAIGLAVTPFECWTYLLPSEPMAPVRPNQVFEGLEKLAQQGIVQCFLGFYKFTESRIEFSDRTVQARQVLAKIKIAERRAKLLMCLPFVRMVALAGSVAQGTAKAGSDIDLFIITTPHRLYLARLGVALVTQVLGWRRHRGHVQNRLCLSFLASELALDLSRFAPEYNVDWYMLCATMHPLGGLDAYARFVSANAWLKQYLPNIWVKGVATQAISTLPYSVFLDSLENFVASLQLWRVHKFLAVNKAKPATAVTETEIFKPYLGNHKIKFMYEFTRRLSFYNLV